MNEAILRLFKGYIGDRSNEVSERALKYGLLIPNSADKEIIEKAIELYGNDGEKWNTTFHKDFEIVKNAPIEDLIAQQVIHYITTYGFESLGMYDSDLVYIPREKLEIPELNVENIEFISIKPITEKELTEKLMILLTSGIALSEKTITDIMTLSDYIDKDRFDEIKNREIKTTLYDKYNVVPKQPEEFLRYLMYKLTGGTLKIQNSSTIQILKNVDKTKALKMLDSYIDKNGYAPLSTIFLRNKNLFLALKRNDWYKDATTRKINYHINKLRRYATKYHKPLKKNILDNLTSKDYDFDKEKLIEELEKTTIFRELRILNGIKYRIYGTENIVYKIRNGKSYVSTIKEVPNFDKLTNVFETIKSHLVSRISQKVNGKKIYIPTNVTYAVPTSEKQFNNNIPEGSYIEIPRNDNIVFGVHWTNIAGVKPRQTYYGEIHSNGEERVDLDLKLMNKGEIYGWNNSYRSNNGDVLFSGDVTDAPLPKGATELYYVEKNKKDKSFLITLNMFTSNSQDVPFEFVIAKAKNNFANTRRNYVIDPNDILTKVDMVSKTTERQMVVGYIALDDTIKFYFNDFSAGVSKSTATQDNITMGAYTYLKWYNKLQVKLNDLLKEAGAIITDKETITEIITTYDENGNEIKQEIEKPVDINLSLEKITKETLIDLLS